MIDTGTLWLMFVLVLVAAAVSIAVLYAVIKAAVGRALHEHSLKTIQAVRIMETIPEGYHLSE